MSIIQQIKEHWLTWLVSLIITTIGITWAVATKIMVEPRNFEIDRLKATIATAQKESDLKQKDSTDNFAMPPTWLREDEGATFLAGQGSVTIRHADSMNIFLRVNLPDGSEQDWNDIQPGGRRSFTYRDRTYFLYVLGADTNRAQIAVGTKKN
ncbi:MAG: hypothetical protein A2283_21265 [Lentisphaerae bacterium RIFOXYA12_FULL_48_11]|nr:MAG: hypothetical protein A2283_21265 [Lentisphaerae bacterium RIFOXYA12_FULL_48_11]